MELKDYTTEELRAELKRRADEKNKLKAIDKAEKDFADAENELKAIQVVGCKMKCEDCEFYHQNDPDYPDNCEYPDDPPCQL